MTMFTDLDNPKGEIGAKARNLSKIAALSTKLFVVPKSLILTTEVFNILKASTGKRVSHGYSFKLPRTLEEKILHNVKTKFSKSNVVVRSSATCEDSILFSAAGQYDSFLNLRTSREIMNAIVKVYGSFSTSNAKLYSSINNVNFDHEGMAVLIQEMAPVIKSGVLFTSNPVSGKREFVVEYSGGTGVTVVSGDGAVGRVVMRNKSEVGDNPLLSKLFQIGSMIEKLFGRPQDIEWGWDGKIIYVFQSRPITTNIYLKKYKLLKFSSRPNLVGKVLAPGLEIGYLKEFKSSLSGGPPNGLNNSILIQKKPFSSKDISQIASSLGFILTTGGLLSHFSNIIRELGKPGILIDATNNHSDSLKGKLVVLDGFNSCCYDWGRLSLTERTSYFERFMLLFAAKRTTGIDKYLGVTARNSDKYYVKLLSKTESQTLSKKMTNDLKKIGGGKIKTISFDFSDRCLKNCDMSVRIHRFKKLVWIDFLKKVDIKSLTNIYENVQIYFDKLSRAIAFLSSRGMIRENTSTIHFGDYKLRDGAVLRMSTDLNGNSSVQIKISRLNKENLLHDINNLILA